MKTIGFSQQEMNDIFRLVAAILWIGNIDFKPDAKGQSAVTDRGGKNLLIFSCFSSKTPFSKSRC